MRKLSMRKAMVLVAVWAVVMMSATLLLWSDHRERSENRRTIFVYDHENLRLLLDEVVNASVWAQYSNLFKSLPRFLEADHDHAEYEVARGSRAAVEAAGLAARSEAGAEVVFVALWEFGLCTILHGDRLFEWEKQKGVLASHVLEKCPELAGVYAALADRAIDGRHAFLVDKLHHKQAAVPWELLYNAKFVGVEERRWFTGCSTHLPIPYFADPTKWSFDENVDTKSVLVGFVGSVGVLYSMCASCHWWLDPSRLRRALLDDIGEGCEARRANCRLRSLDAVFAHRHDVDFLDRHETVAAVMRNSTFCLVPRGDSASTKRFFCAIFALCLPVIVSDHLPLPFQDKIRYQDFVLRINELDLAFPDHAGQQRSAFDAILAIANSPAKLRKAAMAMRHARHQLAFAGPHHNAIRNLVDDLADTPHFAAIPNSVDQPDILGRPPPPPLVGGRRATKCPVAQRPAFNYSSWSFSDW